jgi:hypothetical protein
MAFPTTGILDNFDRTNDATPPPGANWSTVYNGHTIAGNQLVGFTAGDANVSAWIAATYGPGIEAYITCGDSGGYSGLYILDPTLDHGYSIGRVDATHWAIYRADTAGTDETAIGTYSLTVGSNYSIGIYYDAAAETIYFYHKASGGSWTEVNHVADSTYPDMNTLQVFSFSTVALDNFGGGSVAAAAGITYPQLEHAAGRGSFRGIGLGVR